MPQKVKEQLNPFLNKTMAYSADLKWSMGLVPEVFVKYEANGVGMCLSLNTKSSTVCGWIPAIFSDAVGT